jgi:hypothetical protein
MAAHTARTLLLALGLGLALASPPPLVSVAAADPGDIVRIHAGSRTLKDAAGRRWLAAGAALGGSRSHIRRALDISSSRRLYQTIAVGPRRARLRVGRPGRYAVTLYLAEPQRLSGTRVFDVSAPGVTRRVDVPVGSALQRPLHAAFETVVRGRSLTLRFRAVHGRPAVAAIEVQRLGPTGMAPISQRFRERFDGPAGSPPDMRRWAVMTGYGWGAGQLQAYTDRPANVALDGSGRLVIAAHREDYVDAKGNPAAYTSGRIESRGAVSLERARLEARVQTPTGGGLWSAFWAAGVEPPAWPAAGEIDIMEFAGGRSDLLYGFVHGPLRVGSSAPYQNGATLRRSGSFAAAPHTYAIRTEPGVVEFYADGRRYGSVSRADIPRRAPWLLDRSYRVVFNVALGDFGGDVSPATAFPARMTVDDVTLWR